jgi:hypothetical protein
MAESEERAYIRGDEQVTFFVSPIPGGWANQCLIKVSGADLLLEALLRECVAAAKAGYEVVHLTPNRDPGGSGFELVPGIEITGISFVFEEGSDNRVLSFAVSSEAGV